MLPVGWDDTSTFWIIQAFKKVSIKIKTEILKPEFCKMQGYQVILLIYMHKILEIIYHLNLDSTLLQMKQSILPF